MTPRALALAALLSTLALAACGPDAEQAAQDREEADAAAAEAAIANAAPAPEAPAPATPAPAATLDPEDVAPVRPAIDYGGVTGAPLGSSEQSLRAAWPGLATDAPVAAGACHFLYPQPRPAEGFGLAAMVEGDRFVRLDVDMPDVLAPGGGHAGMTADAVRAAYPGQVEEQPHKYVEGGKLLIVTPPGAGEARLVFEVDAAGIVTQWRLGLPPQVHYVEGCA